MSLTRGDLIGNYEIIERLGAGAMGEVAAALNHFNILGRFDVAEHAGRLYLVTGLTAKLIPLYGAHFGQLP